jgi:hypothetical protein
VDRIALPVCESRVSPGPNLEADFIDVGEGQEMRCTIFQSITFAWLCVQDCSGDGWRAHFAAQLTVLVEKESWSQCAALLKT